MTSPDETSWRGAAFGLHLTGDFPAPGLPDGDDEAGAGRRTRLALASREELAGTPDPVAGQPFAMARDGDGGFLFDHPFHGRHRVSPDGTEVACAPSPSLPDWLWQRFLVGQLLPLASLLHRYEPLHASAVAIDGRVVVLMGTSGAGKSSVALHLTATGAGLMADDVTVLELRQGTVVAHPGPRLASIDAGELAGMPAETTAGWTRLGSHGGEVRVITEEGRRAALPVGAVYVLSRRADAEALEIGKPGLGSAEILLGGTFNAYVQDRVRLVRQLELAGCLAETVPLREVKIPAGARAADVAAAVAVSCAELA